MVKCFISYSWDSPEHKLWVKEFASELRKNGVDTILDQWELQFGDRLPLFMEKSITAADFVLIICTPKYKVKSDTRSGGVGYEGDIITSELFSSRNERKFIPILKVGTQKESIPVWLGGKLYVDLTNDTYNSDDYKDLINTLNKTKEAAPPVVKKQSTKVANIVIHKEEMQKEIKITGILVDEVSIPKNDGTRGSALYAIPFKLNHTPSGIWKDLFIENWNYPPSFTTMHRPGIARISGNKIILDGTTIDEVKRYHRDTLILAIDKTNKEELKIMERQNEEAKRKQNEIKKHKSNIDSILKEIEF